MFAHSVLLLVSGQVQSADAHGETQSIFHYGLKTHLRYLRESNFKAFTVYLRQADYLAIEDGVIDDFHVKVVSDAELRQLTAGEQVVTVIQFMPVQRRKGRYSFQVADYAVSRSGTQYQAFKGRRSTFELQLNCETNLFEVELSSQREMLSF